MKISDFVHQLLKFDPQKNLPRLALYHYLKNFSSLNEDFSEKRLTEFFDRCLFFQFWQSNKKQLGQNIQVDIAKSVFQLEDSTQVWQNYKYPHEKQYIVLEYFSDFKKMVESQMNERKQGADKVQLIKTESNKIMTLLLKSDGDLIVNEWLNFCVINDGGIQLLTPITHLHYNGHMELKENTEHFLTFDSLYMASFSVFGPNIRGIITQTHHFQKALALNGPIHQYQELYYALKALESHYIHVPSDPLYQEISLLVEKSINLIEQKHPDCQVIANQTLERGKTAITKVFPNDKLLKVLVTKLKYLVESSQLQTMQSNNQKKSESWPKEKPENLRPLPQNPL